MAVYADGSVRVQHEETDVRISGADGSRMKNAEEKAREYLASSLPHRWQHTHAVATKAADLAKKAGLSNKDSALLLSAAWLHNIGYAPTTPRLYGFPPLDGAELVASWGEPELAALVGWHGLAAEEAILAGLDGMLMKYPCPNGIVPDLLGYADLTTSSGGMDVSPRDRFEELLERHPSGHSNHQAILLGWPRIETLIARAKAALGEH